jgi:hypothetical protein
MLVSENGNHIIDLQLIFSHNIAQIKLELDKPITSKRDVLELLRKRSRSVSFLNIYDKDKLRTIFYIDLNVVPNAIDARWGIGLEVVIDWNKDKDFLVTLGNFALANNGEILFNGFSNSDWLGTDFNVNKLPLIFTYYLQNYIDKTAKYEEEVIERQKTSTITVINSNSYKNQTDELSSLNF